MFTGIIEAVAEVIQRTQSSLCVTRPEQFSDIGVGSSISVSGVCLSIVRLDERSIAFDVVPETWACTMLGDLEPVDRVNLERALPFSRVIPSSHEPFDGTQGRLREGRIEGHIVQGHVDGCGTVVGCRDGEKGKGRVLTVAYPANLHGLIVPKGWIAVDGVSLTITTVAQDHCSVALIPLTLRETTLGELQPENRVNLEADILGKYVQSFVSHS